MADQEPLFHYDPEYEHVVLQHYCSERQGWGEDGRAFRALPHGPNGWKIISIDPLTVAPSIQCSRCGLHGFIRDGKWQAVPGA